MATADGTCSRVEITPTVNGGFSVQKYYKPPKSESKQSDACCGPSYMEPKAYAFSTFEELTTFLKSSLGTGGDARIVERQG